MPGPCGGPGDGTNEGMKNGKCIKEGQDPGCTQLHLLAPRVDWMGAESCKGVSAALQPIQRGPHSMYVTVRDVCCAERSTVDESSAVAAAARHRSRRSRRRLFPPFRLSPHRPSQLTSPTAAIAEPSPPSPPGSSPPCPPPCPRPARCRRLTATATMFLCPQQRGAVGRAGSIPGVFEHHPFARERPEHVENCSIRTAVHDSNQQSARRRGWRGLWQPRGVCLIRCIRACA